MDVVGEVEEVDVVGARHLELVWGWGQVAGWGHCRGGT